MDVIDSIGTYTNGMTAMEASCLALLVFPVPGGPSKRTALGGRADSSSRVPREILSRAEGSSKLSRRLSSICLFCSSYPAMLPQSLSNLPCLHRSKATSFDLVVGKWTLAPNPLRSSSIDCLNPSGDSSLVYCGGAPRLDLSAFSPLRGARVVLLV